MIKPLILSFQENRQEATSYKFIPVFCFNLLDKFGVICLTSSTFRTDIPSSCVDVMMMAIFSDYRYLWMSVVRHLQRRITRTYVFR